MPTQEYALDPTGTNRVQIFQEGSGGTVTVLFNRSIVGSIPTQEELMRGREFLLKDGSVLRVQLVNGNTQVLSNGQVLPSVVITTKEPKVRPASSSQSIYILTHPSIAMFVAEAKEATWGRIWARFAAYIVVSLVFTAVVGFRLVLFAPFEFFTFLIFLAIFLGILLVVNFFTQAGLSYLGSRLFQGQRTGTFLVHSYLLAISQLPLSGLVFFCIFLGIIFSISNWMSWIILLLAAYSIVLLILALMAAHKMNAAKAVGAALLSTAVSAGIIFMFFFAAVYSLTFLLRGLL